MAIGESTQRAIVIDRVLWKELDSFLKTELAKKFGYHSKAQFATEAVRNQLCFWILNK